MNGHSYTTNTQKYGNIHIHHFQLEPECQRGFHTRSFFVENIFNSQYVNSYKLLDQYEINQYEFLKYEVDYKKYSKKIEYIISIENSDESTFILDFQGKLTEKLTQELKKSK